MGRTITGRHKGKNLPTNQFCLLLGILVSYIIEYFTLLLRVMRNQYAFWSDQMNKSTSQSYFSWVIDWVSDRNVSTRLTLCLWRHVYTHISSFLQCLQCFSPDNKLCHWPAGLSTISPMMQSHGKPTSCLTLSISAFWIILRIIGVNISFWMNKYISLSLCIVIYTSLSTQKYILFYFFQFIYKQNASSSPGLNFYVASPCSQPRGLTQWPLHMHLYSFSKNPLFVSIFSFIFWQFPVPAVDYTSAHLFQFLGLVLVALIFTGISCDIISLLLSIWSLWPFALLLLLTALSYSLVLRSLTPAIDLSTLVTYPHPIYFLLLSLSSSSALSLAMSLLLLFPLVFFCLMVVSLHDVALCFVTLHWLLSCISYLDRQIARQFHLC